MSSCTVLNADDIILDYRNKYPEVWKMIHHVGSWYKSMDKISGKFSPIREDRRKQISTPAILKILNIWNLFKKIDPDRQWEIRISTFSMPMRVLGIPGKEIPLEDVELPFLISGRRIVLPYKPSAVFNCDQSIRNSSNICTMKQILELSIPHAIVPTYRSMIIKYDQYADAQLLTAFLDKKMEPISINDPYDGIPSYSRSRNIPIPDDVRTSIGDDVFVMKVNKFIEDILDGDKLPGCASSGYWTKISRFNTDLSIQ